MNNAAICGLLRKEWLISKNVFCFLLFAFLIIWTTALCWNLFHNESEFLWWVTNLLISLHVIYLVWIVGSGLELEARSQMWLHSPQSTSLLLGSKLLTGFYLQCISGTITMSLLIPTNLLSQAGYIGKSTADTIPYVQSWVHIMVSGIELTVYFMFYWTIYHVLRKYIPSKQIGVFLLILFIGCSQLGIIFLEGQFFKGVDMLFPIPLEMMKVMNIHIADEGVEVNANGDASFHPINIVISLVKAIGLFYIASKVLNKVVEAK